MGCENYGTRDPYEKNRSQHWKARSSREKSELDWGQVIVVCVIAVLAGFEILTTAAKIARTGSVNAFSDGFRSVLTVGLCIGLYTGQPWARYTIVALLGISSILLLGQFTSMPEDATLGRLVASAVVLAGYAGSTVALLAFPSVGRFMKRQRGEN